MVWQFFDPSLTDLLARATEPMKTVPLGGHSAQIRDAGIRWNMMEYVTWSRITLTSQFDPCVGIHFHVNVGFSFSTKMDPPTNCIEVSNILVVLVFCCLGLLFVWLLLCGLPKKPLQDESVKNGCPRSWAIFMGLLVLCASWIFLDCLGGCELGEKKIHASGLKFPWNPGRP